MSENEKRRKGRPDDIEKAILHSMGIISEEFQHRFDLVLEAINGLRQELKSDIAELRVEMRAEFADLRLAIRNASKRMDHHDADIALLKQKVG